MNTQVGCYEDSKLLKLFTDIIRILYDNDIVAEDTIMWWAKKGAHPKVWPSCLLLAPHDRDLETSAMLWCEDRGR